MDKYEQLRRALDAHPSGAPKSEAFDEILRILFSEDDVDLLLVMNYRGKTADDIAAAAALPAGEVRARLEAMAERAVIFYREKDGARFYGLLPTIPGIFEFPFMRGGGTPMHERLSALWDRYKHDGQAQSFAGNPTPLMRVVPVARSLDSKNVVHPYDEVAKLIEGAEYIALAECACRVSLKRCDSPTDVCLIFGTMGKFLVQAGYARHASKEDAMDALGRAEAAGLVHTSNNSADGASVICNCCSCCCTVLRGRLELGLKTSFDTSRFVPGVNEALCNGCAICAEERCPAKAIDMRSDGVAVIRENDCIGCGLCVSGCPEKAMAMVARKGQPETPKTGQDLAVKVHQEKGKLEKFMEIMKK